MYVMRFFQAVSSDVAKDPSVWLSCDRHGSDFILGEATGFHVTMRCTMLAKVEYPAACGHPCNRIAIQYCFDMPYGRSKFDPHRYSGEAPQYFSFTGQFSRICAALRVLVEVILFEDRCGCQRKCPSNHACMLGHVAINQRKTIINKGTGI